MRKKIKCPHCGSEEGLEHRISMTGCDIYIQPMESSKMKLL